jgi:carbon-monoxide dehydrogenase medium subunit
MTDYVLDIKKIPELRRIEWRSEEGLCVGAACTIADLEASPHVKRHASLLSKVIPHFANTQIRNRATLGGNVVRSSPSGDTLPALLAMEARLKVIGDRGERLLTIDGFFTGPGENALDDGELLAEIQIPGDGSHARGTSFQKLKRTQLDLAKMNVAVMLDCEGTVIKRARVAAGAVAPVPKRLRTVERTLENAHGSEGLWDKAIKGVSSEIQPITDVRSTSGHRAYVTGICTRRALQEAWEEVGK